MATSIQHVRSYADAEEGANDYAELFRQSLDLLCVAGLDDGYFKRLNPAWNKTLGWSDEELVGKPFLDFVHPDDRQRTLDEVAGLAEGRDAVLFENRYRHSNGSYVWLRWNARPELIGRRIYAIARDVTQLKWLERQFLEVLDRERERMGRELHDGLCQTLAGIAALSLAHSKRLKEADEFLAATEIAELLHGSIAEAHSLALDLGPVGLTESGLDETLETLVRNTEHRFNVPCTLEIDGPVNAPDPEARLQLYRIAQEAVSNAIAHGHAERLTIGLTRNDNAGVLSIRDNGVGLPEGAHKSNGIGLHTMDFRARLIGATVEVRRRNRRGTRVTCTFPLSTTPGHHENSKHDASNS